MAHSKFYNTLYTYFKVNGFREGIPYVSIRDSKIVLITFTGIEGIVRTNTTPTIKDLEDIRKDIKRIHDGLYK